MKLISFCIPTYNRAPQCIRLVKEILKSQNEDFEVIVADNCSTDDTVALLRKIQDKRLFIHAATHNKGSFFNGLNSFSKAKGKYIYFTTDKDMIDFSNIDSFVLFLKGNDISCGYCEYSPKPESIDRIYPQGYDAIHNVGYLGRHPSGSFFNREKLEELNYLERFSDYEFVGEFAVDYMLSELASKGNAGIFRKQLTISQAASEAAIDRSLTIIGLNKNAYYTPDARLKTTVNQTIHISSLKISLKDKEKLIVKIFMTGLINATFGYKNLLRNGDICEHYHLESRKMMYWELIWAGFGFYKKYLERTKPNRQAANLHMIKLSYYVVRVALGRVAKRRFYA
jgi:glycosyltransferase involved in cell wall biosynthesis